MFSWLWGSSKKETETPKLVINPHKKAQSWKKGPTGQWEKSNPTTAAITQVLAQPPSIHSAPPITTNKKLFNDTDTSTAQDDALGDYEIQLKKTAADLQKTLESWKLLKENVIGDDEKIKGDSSTLRAYAAVESKAGRHVVNGIEQFFINMFNDIKQDLEPADHVLQEVLDKTHKDVQVLCDHLSASCNALKDGGIDDEKKRKICIDMCNTSIEITNDLIMMVDMIQRELSYCLDFEKITETVANHLVELAVLIIFKVPMPDIGFSFSNSYRHFLYNEIEHEKNEIDIYESDVKGALNKAMNAIKLQEKKWTEKEMTMVKLYPETSLFKANPSDHEKQQPVDSSIDAKDVNQTSNFKMKW